MAKNDENESRPTIDPQAGVGIPWKRLGSWRQWIKDGTAEDFRPADLHTGFCVA